MAQDWRASLMWSTTISAQKGQPIWLWTLLYGPLSDAVGACANLTARAATRAAFVIDNVHMWIRIYHLDGLRLDAVHAIYDFGARHILQDIKEAADEAAGGRRFLSMWSRKAISTMFGILSPPGASVDTALMRSGVMTSIMSSMHASTGERQGTTRIMEILTRCESLRALSCWMVAIASIESLSWSARGRTPRRSVRRLHPKPRPNRQSSCRGASRHPDFSPPAQRLAAALLLLAPHCPCFSWEKIW